MPFQHCPLGQMRFRLEMQFGLMSLTLEQQRRFVGSCIFSNDAYFESRYLPTASASFRKFLASGPLQMILTLPQSSC